MVDVLLIYPPYTYTRKNPPLGLGYIASSLENANYSVKILDMSAIGMNYNELKFQANELKPKLIGISFMTNQHAEMLKVAEVAKAVNSNIPVVIGGPHASAIPEDSLRNKNVDIVVIGEGDVTMTEIALWAIKHKIKLKEIKGLAYKIEKNIVRITPPREAVHNLDLIPFPAWHLLPVERYSVLASGGDMRRAVLPILSSRGCPNFCTFCDSHSIFGRNFRGRSAKNIFDEMLFLNNRYGVTQFDFVDDTITIDKKRVKELCQLILNSNRKFSWMCNARVNTVDAEILQLMKDSGCVRIDLGVESGDPEVLKAIKKGITIEQIKTAHKTAQAVGITSNSFVMVGNLNETFESIKKTVNLIKEFAEDINVAIATPFPGTELFQIAKNNGWLRTVNWSEYVTSPTYLPGYRPVMITDKMNEAEIMKSFYYIHSRFAGKKFQTRYGKIFYFNPSFYSDKLFKVKNWPDFVHKLKMFFRLIYEGFSRS